jgi:hypothetical protein
MHLEKMDMIRNELTHYVKEKLDNFGENKNKNKNINFIELNKELSVYDNTNEEHQKAIEKRIEEKMLLYNSIKIHN